LVFLVTKKIVTMIVLLMMVLSTAVSASAAISVGVKKGDWIEYQASFQGTPPSDHNVEWARTEVTDVQGPIIYLNITDGLSNGTVVQEDVVLNLETGHLGDDFIIPANLSVGDTFLDYYHGKMTISGVEDGTYGGAVRTVVFASTALTTYYWDRATGVLVKGVTNAGDYTMNSIVHATNMWQAQPVGVRHDHFVRGRDCGCFSRSLGCRLCRVAQEEMSIL
jgi:hypothetical protein